MLKRECKFTTQLRKSRKSVKITKNSKKGSKVIRISVVGTFREEILRGIQICNQIICSRGNAKSKFKSKMAARTHEVKNGGALSSGGEKNGGQCTRDEEKKNGGSSRKKRSTKTPQKKCRQNSFPPSLSRSLKHTHTKKKFQHTNYFLLISTIK